MILVFRVEDNAVHDFGEVAEDLALHLGVLQLLAVEGHFLELLGGVDVVGRSEGEDSGKLLLENLVVEVFDVRVHRKVLLQVVFQHLLVLRELIHIVDVVEEQLEVVFGQVVAVQLYVLVPQKDLLVDHFELKQQLVLVRLDVVKPVYEVHYILEVQLLRHCKDRIPNRHDHSEEHDLLQRILDGLEVGREKLSLLVLILSLLMEVEALQGKLLRSIFDGLIQSLRHLGQYRKRVNSIEETHGDFQPHSQIEEQQEQEAQDEEETLVVH